MIRHIREFLKDKFADTLSNEQKVDKNVLNSSMKNSIIALSKNKKNKNRIEMKENKHMPISTSKQN